MPYRCSVGETIEDFVLLNEKKAAYTTKGNALSHTLKVINLNTREKSLVFDPYSKDMVPFFGDNTLFERTGKPAVTIEEVHYAPTTERLYFRIKNNWFSTDLGGQVKLELDINYRSDIPHNEPKRSITITTSEGTIHATE